MSKAMRFGALVLCILLLGGMTAAHAEMVTVGITLTGLIPDGNGSTRSVVPEGEFRVFQNGEEAGVIAAGRDTLTLNSRERIRIEPVPQSFAPEWDLSTAYITPELTGESIQLIPVTITAREAAAAATPTPEPEPVPTETKMPETDVPGTETDVNVTETPAQETPVPEIEIQPAQQSAAELPTLPPYTGTSATQEPVPAGFSAAGTGSLRIQVFFDKNGSGNQGDYEYGIANLTIYLLNEAEEVLAAAVTDTDGFAVFENVPAGRYRTRTNLPEGWYFTPYGGENKLTLNAYDITPAGSQTSGLLEISDGAESQQGIAIHNNAASAYGFCWLEGDVDGLYKDGETKFGGVRIRLRDRENDFVYETETDENGSWSISNLRPGYYVLTCEGPDGLMLTRYTQSRGKRSYLTSDNPRRQMELKTDSRTEMNIGFNWAAQVFGRCYLDANYNGLYDEGELPLAGVKLTAKYQYDNAEASTTVSGDDGTYVLDALRGNQYSITVLLPADGSIYTKAVPSEPLGNLFPPRGDRRDNTLNNLKLEDMEQREMNIGAIYPASISGTVYFDDNFSATADGSEKAVAGFTVTVRDADGNAVATTRTNGEGVYKVENLTPGDYSLDVAAASGYAFTKRGEGNVILNRTGGQGYSELFRVELGASVTGRDIGMIRPGTVRGVVFADRNDNGVRDAGEDGLTGVKVRLMSETEGEAFNAEIGTDGAFLFDAVMPGRYYLEYMLPERAVFARITNGGNQITEMQIAETGSIGRTDSFDFVTGQVVDAPVCGALTLGRIEGTAYRDHDGNGRMENEETLAGVTVKLIPSREQLDTITAVTGEDGAFLLEDLRPDSYRLEIECPDGYVVSRTDSLKLPLTAGKARRTVALDVPMGAEGLDQKTGAVRPAAICGQVWLDENNNGVFDEDERTPAGYTLYLTDETTGNVFDTPVTDENGIFASEGIIPGKFTLSMPLDEKTLAPKEGDTVFRQENGSLVLSGIELEEGKSLDSLLMGVVRYTSVTGRAWIDRGEGTENLGGVRVVMKDPAGGVIAETETDSSGSYRIDRLMPGTFRLEITAPEGCVIIEPDDPRLQGSLRSVVQYPTNRLGSTDEMELKMDQDMNGMDIGCVLPGRLGDYCWMDLNRDGLQAGDEPGIPNVRIELLRNGTVIADTETDQYGFYRFVDLYPATYTLRVYAPDEVKPTQLRTDLPMIASVLEESEEGIVFSVPLTVESNRNQYNADLGFICRRDGVMPAGVGQGETQDWTPKY